MFDDGKPSSWTTRLFRASAYLLGAIILLHLTIALIREIWWVFLLAGIAAVAVVALKWWRWLRNPWK